MNTKEVEKRIEEALQHAMEKHPTWPRDPLHAIAILQEEVGGLQKAVLQWVYENGEPGEIIKEAVQVGAMVMRFLGNLDYYYKSHSDQRIDQPSQPDETPTMTAAEWNALPARKRALFLLPKEKGGQGGTIN